MKAKVSTRSRVEGIIMYAAGAVYVFESGRFSIPEGEKNASTF